MIDEASRPGQLDLLVRAANALESGRVPPATWAEVTALLKQMLSAHIATDAVPPEAADE